MLTPVNTSTDKQLVDEAVDAYADWREECVAVWDAYGRWKSAPRADAPLAFAAFTAALDIEEQASVVYASAIGRVGHPVTAHLQHISELVLPAE
jgi:hypothetical protein